ncbi:conserved Plasmodium protein, unknown function [Plasmodium malariae]|uniref:Uncharacterized protein n=1 Tax=Plasmodium malariae TaxID=5858 RepID=A0A1D3TD53_PLAMA|nr:conserved Plasmodium protein, unknown function [Plasmodium malariae]SCP02827.1 conserved Plasmodium protein, unknown function [Plasmodium malariae]
MEIKLNTIFNDILLLQTDEHKIENHDKCFVDKRQNILCAECINKILFNNCPLYKKYLLFKSLNDIYSVNNCHDFRHHFSFFLLDHTLFLSNTFEYLEGTTKLNEQDNDNNKEDDYAYSVNNELIILATNACKEFLNICSEDLCNIFKDAIYTCVLVRLKKISSYNKKKKNSFILKFLKNLIDHIEVIHTTLKEESVVIEGFMKLFIQNYSINENSKNEKPKKIYFYPNQFFLNQQNDSINVDDYNNKELLLTLQIIYSLWNENSLWQIKHDLLKNFFIILIKNFKYINKNTDLCNYCIEFIYLITKNLNDITYFFNTIIFHSESKKGSQEAINTPTIVSGDNINSNSNHQQTLSSSIHISSNQKERNWNDLFTSHYLGKNNVSYESGDASKPEELCRRSEYNKNEILFEIYKDEGEESTEKGKLTYKRKNSEKKYNENYTKEVELKHINYKFRQKEKACTGMFIQEKNKNKCKDKYNQSEEQTILVHNYSDEYELISSEEENISKLLKRNYYKEKIGLNLSKESKNFMNNCSENYKGIINISTNISGEYSNYGKKGIECNSNFFKTKENSDNINMESLQMKQESSKNQGNEQHYYHDLNSSIYSIISTTTIPNEFEIGNIKQSRSNEGISKSSENKEVEEAGLGEPESDEPYLEGSYLEGSDRCNEDLEQFEEIIVQEESQSIHSQSICKENKRIHNMKNGSKEEIKNNAYVYFKTRDINNTLSYGESYYNSGSEEKNTLDIKITEKYENIHIFIILCDNLQEALLNNINRDIQMKCLDIFYKFCSIDEAIVNIILSHTSLVEWIFDFISNTKYECLREKALNFLVTFFFNNSLFSHTHAHYMLDVLINIISKYVNRNSGIYNNVSSDYSIFFYFLKALDMLIHIAYSSIKILHIFKVINIISFLVVSPNSAPTNIKDIISFFENLLLKNSRINTNVYHNSRGCNVINKNNGERYELKKNEMNLPIHKKTFSNIYDESVKGNDCAHDCFLYRGPRIHKNDFPCAHNKRRTGLKNGMKSEVTEHISGKIIRGISGHAEVITHTISCKSESRTKYFTNDIINKFYVTNISSLFKVLKTVLNIIKIVNKNKEDIYVELIYNEPNNSLNELCLAIMKLLFSLTYILNRNDNFLINEEIINEKDNFYTDNNNNNANNNDNDNNNDNNNDNDNDNDNDSDGDNDNELQIFTFIKIILYFFIELHSFFRNIMKERKDTPFEKDILNFIKILYLSCIYIFEDITERKKLFNNISTSICFSSFFTPFFHLFSNILTHVEEISASYLHCFEKDPHNTAQNRIEQHVDTNGENKNDQLDTDNYKELTSVIFAEYKKRIKQILIKNKPFTLFFQYVHSNNYNPECYRILELLIYEEGELFKEKKNKKDILIEIIKKNDFYFTKVLLFNFNDNEDLIETVIYIFYLCLNHDKNFIEKKLNISKVDNYVENIFSLNDFEVNINPLFLFMALSYSYYFITKDKILSLFTCIKKEMYKINVPLWLNIKKIKNIYFAFDCIFSLKINSGNYSLYISFIIYIIKLELSLYSSKQADQVDSRLYLSISKNNDLVKRIFENVETDKIPNNHIIYVYYLIIKLRKYCVEQCKSLSLYKMMNTVIRYMSTAVNTAEEINDIFSFFFIFFENLEIFAQTDIFNIITLLQKLSFYVKSSMKEFFNKNNNLKEVDNNEILPNSLKFENSFFYFILNLILYCRKYNQIQNINVLSSSISLIQLLIYAIQFTNNHFKSLSILILSLLILPMPKTPKTVSPLLMKLSTSFDKCAEDILLLDSKTSMPTESSSSTTSSTMSNHISSSREKYVIRKNLFFPLVSSTHANIRLSSLSLLLSLLLTNNIVLLDEEVFSFFIFLINSSFLSEWNDIQNDLLFAIINVLLLSTILNLKAKSFCFNFIYSFRPFFLRGILRLSRNENIIIHKLFFLLITVKIKPLWFDLKSYSEKILKILLNIVTKKDLDIMTFNCISSLAYETFTINKNNTEDSSSKEGVNKCVIGNLEEYLETYKKNIRNNDGDVYCTLVFNKFKCEHIDYDAVLAVLNTTRLLLYK